MSIVPAGYGFTTSKFTKDGSAARVTTKPRVDRAVPAQAAGGRAYCGGYVPPVPCGSYATSTGQPVQDCAYPYWSMLLWGTEPVYRLMMQQQTLALARYTVTGPVRASSWDITWDDSIDKGDPAIRWVTDNILPLRRAVIREAIRAVDFGWQPFAVRWEIRDGLYCPEPMPLLPDATVVLRDGSTFAGLENYPAEGKEQKFNDLESWAPSLDGEAGYPYGRSRYENVRTTAWAPWLNTVMRMQELQQKISGVIPIVQHPPNGYVDDDGNAINYRTGANTLLSELPRGHGVAVEGALDPREIINNTPEFADKLSQVKIFDIDFLDAGSVSPAVVGFISLLEYWDKQLFRGMLRGERSGLEAVAAGSRADSESHSRAGAADSEAIDADLTESADKGWIRTALRLNFGEDVARRIHVISTPLQEWKQQVFRELITRLVSIPDVAVSVAKSLDLDAMFTQMSLPAKKEFVFEAMKQNPTPPQDSGVKPAPTNGNGKAAMEQLADHLATALHARFPATN